MDTSIVASEEADLAHLSISCDSGEMQQPLDKAVPQVIIPFQAEPSILVL
jgi:hypothetical protein